MFYSTEVLRNNRSSLGMVWSAAWGRKLARSSVLNIKIDQTCEQLMDPEVPQALRLQAILASGIVKLHEKKVDYLKEDAEHAMKRLCDTNSGGKRSIDLVEKRSRKKRTTTISSQIENRQTLELFFGPSGLEARDDFHFGESYDYNGLDKDYFLPESLDPEMVMSFPFEEGMEERNYIMNSPDNVPDFNNAMISDGIQCHFEMGSPTSVCDQAKILVKPKRKRRPKMDQGIVDMSTWVEYCPRLNNHQDGGCDMAQNLNRKFASFEFRASEKKSSLDFCLEKIHIQKKPKTMVMQDGGISNPKNGQEAQFFDTFDPRDSYYYDEREVEVEQLRNALHMTPNQQKFGYQSNSKSLANSSGDASREESGYLSNRSSVQKDRLSGLFNASRYDLENDEQLGHYSSEEAPFGNLDDFKLKETGPSQSLMGSFGKMQEWDKSSHTMEILTKARLCSKKWGAASILLLDDLTSHLNRHEAAAMFHHILVGSSSGLIRAHQDYAYGPITIEFDF